jgi:hypothetical protein
MKTILRSLVPLAVATTATAQFPLQGFLFNWDRPGLTGGLSLITRWSTGAETDLTRVDHDDFRDWGIDANGQIKVRGFVTWIFDDDYGTAQSFGVVGHQEDPANLDAPLATSAFQVPGIPMPPGVNGNIYRVGATFTQSFALTGGADTFVGLELPAMTSPVQPFDGLWIGTAARSNPQLGLTVFDEPGPRGQVGAGVARECYTAYVVNGQARYPAPNASSLQQLAIDVVIDSGMAGGVALAQTNQTTYPSSNAPLGTSNFISGLHPDVNGLNPGRADDIGFGVTHHTAQMPVGSLVFVMFALGPSPIGSLPVSTFGANSPDSAGNVCIDFTAAATFLAFTQPGAIANMGEAQVIVALSPVARSIIASIPGSLDFWWQGFALDATSANGLEVRTTGCVLQHVK